MMNRFSKATLTCAFLAPWLIGVEAAAQTPGKDAQPLPPVTISDPIAVFLHEFENRRRRGIGYYITAAELRASHGRSLPDILMSRFPGLRMSSSGVPMSTRGPNNFRGSCPVAVWYNGMRDAAAADLRGSDMIPLGLLGGIEYYTPGYTPAKYRDGKSACGVMLVWSGF
ncbi:MAG: Plug domain-containing protein [Gemmatimonadota bacterium]|nr:Plug domain-containing protein [Gemmatimonadota bacterium]